MNYAIEHLQKLVDNGSKWIPLVSDIQYLGEGDSCHYEVSKEYLTKELKRIEALLAWAYDYETENVIMYEKQINDLKQALNIK